jgi:hypothetical protein
MCGLEVTP